MPIVIRWPPTIGPGASRSPRLGQTYPKISAGRAAVRVDHRMNHACWDEGFIAWFQVYLKADYFLVLDAKIELMLKDKIVNTYTLIAC